MKIDLTDTEITHIMDALDGRVEDLRDTLLLGADPMIEDEIAELTDLSMDLFEAMSRKDDGWDPGHSPSDCADLDNANAQFIQAGIDAREQVKASSRAAERRNERLMKGTTGTIANDPIDW